MLHVFKILHWPCRYHRAGIMASIILLATEAGIAIALFWNADRYAAYWPKEVP